MNRRSQALIDALNPKRHLRLAGLGCLLVAGLLPAQTDIWSKITAAPGAASLAIALAEFGSARDPASDAADFAAAIRKVVTADLSNSLLFNIKRPEPDKKPGSTAAAVDYEGWAATGASVLVAGDISAGVVTLRLYDLLSRRLLVTKDYPRTATARTLGHRIADEIIRFLTGEEGVSTSRILFARRQGRGREFYSTDPDGADLAQLTSDGMVKLSPDWSPDGTRIAYSAYYGSKLVLFTRTLNPGSSNVVCDAAGMNDTPAWSPDGRRIAAALSTDAGMEIYTMAGTGRDLHQVTRNQSINTSPTWSPNGKQIAFVSDRAGSPQVYIINADGTSQRRLSFEGNYNTGPAWSPRGDVIAYSRREENRNQIFISDLEGEATKQLTFEGNNVDPNFSPDGLHIVFISSRTGTDDVWVMNWDGTNQRRLTRLGGCSAPTWSPPLKP